MYLDSSMAIIAVTPLILGILSQWRMGNIPLQAKNEREDEMSE